jgi:hypothetical protein
MRVIRPGHKNRSRRSSDVTTRPAATAPAPRAWSRARSPRAVQGAHPRSRFCRPLPADIAIAGPVRRRRWSAFIVSASQPIRSPDGAKRNPGSAGQQDGPGFRGACHRARIRATRWLHPGYGRSDLPPRGNSHMAAMRKLPVVLICRRPLVLPKTPNQPHIRSVPPHKRGVSRSSRTLGAGCNGRFGGARRAALNADGEVVWSWRPDAGAKSAEAIPPMTVAKEPGHRGEHEVTVKTIAQGRPG